MRERTIVVGVVKGEIRGGRRGWKVEGNREGRFDFEEESDDGSERRVTINLSQLSLNSLGYEHEQE